MHSALWNAYLRLWIYNNHYIPKIDSFFSRFFNMTKLRRMSFFCHIVHKFHIMERKNLFMKQKNMIYF